jgi:hypothetical protein
LVTGHRVHIHWNDASAGGICAWAIGLIECTNRLCRLQGDRGRFSIFDD